MRTSRRLTFSSILAATVLSSLLATDNAYAEILILKCDIAGIGLVYFTRYSDGSPSRVGIVPGIGSKALFFQDRLGAQIFIETNTDGSPVTFTTIERDLKAIQSRHWLQPDGTVLAPSQNTGRCQRVDIN